MKALFTTAVLLALLLSAPTALGQSTPSTDEQAAIRKGSIGLSGSANLWLDGSPGSTSSQGGVSPFLSFFVRDNLSVTVGLSYSGSSRKSLSDQLSFFIPGQFGPILVQYSGEQIYGSWSLSASLGINYYKWLGKRLALVGLMGLSGGLLQNTHEITPPPLPSGQPWSGVSNGFIIQASLSPGLAYAMSERWLLTASFGSLLFRYSETKRAPEFDQNSSLFNLRGSTGSSFQASLSSGLSLGFTYFLRRR